MKNDFVPLSPYSIPLVHTVLVTEAEGLPKLVIIIERHIIEGL